MSSTEKPKDKPKISAGIPDLGPRNIKNAPVLCGPACGSENKWFRINAAVKAGDATEIVIYDTIGKDWWSDRGVEASAFAEELKKIPRNQEILVRVNSPGGSVADGLLIYNLLAERRQHVVTQVDSLAASIASVIILAGREVKMPRNARVMIHNPWTYAEGDAREMRRVADKLDIHRDSIAVVYEQKTGKKREEIHELMDAETWMTGDLAKEHGFADVVTDEEISFQACAGFDLSSYKHVPEQLKQQQKQQGNKEHSMNRKKIIARLEKLGVKFDNKATTETLNALLTESTARAKMEARLKEFEVEFDKDATDSDIEALLCETVETASQTEAETETDEEVEEEEASAPSNRARNRAAQSLRTNADVTNRLKAIEAENKAIQARYEAERKSRISTAVQQCVDEDKIPAAQAGKWVDRIMADESVLTDLQAMEPRRPGADPLNLTVTGEDPRTIENGLIRMRDAINSFMRGNHVEPKAIADRAKITAMTIARERKKLDVILNTNTIDPTLKRTVILTDVLRAFVRRLLILNVFTTKFENVPLQGTNKIAVPFYDLDETASTDYVAATGYTFAEDTNVGVRELTINKRKFKSMDFTSDTFRRQPYFKPDIAMSLKSEQLAVDVWTDILSIVKAQHYGEVGFSVEPSAFDSDDMARLQKVADDNDWPDLGRAFVGGTGHRQGLASDDAIKHWQNSGSTETLREGSIGRLSGFDTYFSPRIPANSEDLAAFICLPQAALVATAPVMPAPGVRQHLLAYEVVVDPQTGISFEYRYGADVWKDTDREVVECNYGYAKGNGSALKRLTAGAGEFSSSSSASSVNSSSSSSSSASF